MNKIVLNAGALSFFLSIIYFGQRGFPVIEVLIKSFIVFAFSTTALGLLALVVVRYHNKNSQKKAKEMIENILGNNNE